MLTATDPVIAGLAKDADMGSKPILESTADVPEHAIARYVRRCIIESLIYRWKGRVDPVISGVSVLAGQAASVRARWARTVVRVAGSWIAAIGLLMLGWMIRVPA